MSQIQEWFEKEFKPWQQQAKAYQQAKEGELSLLKNKSTGLQAVLGDVLAGKMADAVVGWNALKLEPQLAQIVLDHQADKINLVAKNGTAVKVQMDTLLKQLNRIIG